MQPLGRIERRLARTVGHEFERAEQAAAADIADMGMLAEPRLEATLQEVAHRDDVREEIVAPDDLLHGERRRRRHRVSHGGVAVLERAGAVGEGVENALRQEDRADRLVAAAEPLGDRHEVGRDPFLRASVERPGASHAAHDFVEDEQDAVAVADRAYALEIISDRGNHRPSAPTTVSATKAITVSGPSSISFISSACAARRIIRLALPVALPVGVAGVDVVRLDEERRERFSPPGGAADGEGAQRIAVVALPARDDPPHCSRRSRRNIGAPS